MVVSVKGDLYRVLGPFLVMYLCVSGMALDKHVYGGIVVNSEEVWCLI